MITVQQDILEYSKVFLKTMFTYAAEQKQWFYNQIFIKLKKTSKFLIIILYKKENHKEGRKFILSFHS